MVRLNRAWVGPGEHQVRARVWPGANGKLVRAGDEGELVACRRGWHGAEHARAGEASALIVCLELQALRPELGEGSGELVTTATGRTGRGAVPKGRDRKEVEEEEREERRKSEEKEKRKEKKKKNSLVSFGIQNPIKHPFRISFRNIVLFFHKRNLIRVLDKN